MRMEQQWIQVRQSHGLLTRPPCARTPTKSVKHAKHAPHFEASVRLRRQKVALKPFEAVLVTMGPGPSAAC
jgi:hypothetical protein